MANMMLSLLGAEAKQGIYMARSFDVYVKGRKQARQLSVLVARAAECESGRCS